MAIKRIAPAGGDYTTLSAWYASLPGTLTEPEIAELEAFDLVEQFTGSAKNTTDANYIEIRAAAGHGHNGVPGSGARIRCGSSPTLPPVYITATHFRFRGIEVYMDKAGGTQEAFTLVNAAPESEVRVEGCIIRSVCADAGVPTVNLGAGNSTFQNNVVVSPCRSLDTRAAASAKVINNVLWRTADAIGFLADNNTEARNNYSGASTGSSQCYYTATGGTGSHNVSSDASATALYPTGSINNVSGAAAFTAPGTLDFTLAAGSPLIDAGTTVASVTTDIVGTARPQGAAYDIGAYEVEVGGATPVSFGGTVPDQTGTVGVVFSLDVAAYFSGSETPFSYAIQAGTLPAGLALSGSTISGTPTAAGAQTGIVVRATDTASDTADTNAFSITIAPPAGITLPKPWTNNATTVRANESSVRVSVRRADTLQQVYYGAGHATDAAGYLETISDAAIVAGVIYHVDVKFADGGVGTSEAVAAS